MNSPQHLKSAVWLFFLAVLLIPGGRAFGAPETALTALAAAMDKLPESLQQNNVLRTDLKVLLQTYGSAIRGLEVTSPNRVYLVMRDGQKILYDDGRPKSFDEKLQNADLKDMLSQPYKPGQPSAVTSPDQDPGRIRVGAFFNAVYGTDAGQVQNNLVPVNFAGVRTSFNSQNGAAAALARVGDKAESSAGEGPRSASLSVSSGRDLQPSKHCRH